jgi:hypothetical protein
MTASVLRRTAVVTAITAAFVLASFVPIASGAGATVLKNDVLQCFFEPGDVPGVDVFFPATFCQAVLTPSGNVEIVAHGLLPAGFSLEETFVGPVPCFGGTGMIVATPSGEVTATCQFR